MAVEVILPKVDMDMASGRGVSWQVARDVERGQARVVPVHDVRSRSEPRVLEARHLAPHLREQRMGCRDCSFATFYRDIHFRRPPRCGRFSAGPRSRFGS